MTPGAILDAVSKYGLPLIFLGVILWRIWPFLEDRVRHSEQMAQEMMQTGQDRWAEIAKEFISIVKQEREVLEKLVREIEHLREDVRGIKRK